MIVLMLAMFVLGIGLVFYPSYLMVQARGDAVWAHALVRVRDEEIRELKGKIPEFGGGISPAAQDEINRLKHVYQTDIMERDLEIIRLKSGERDEKKILEAIERGQVVVWDNAPERYTAKRTAPREKYVDELDHMAAENERLTQQVLDLSRQIAYLKQYRDPGRAITFASLGSFLDQLCELQQMGKATIERPPKVSLVLLPPISHFRRAREPAALKPEIVHLRYDEDAKGYRLPADIVLCID